MIEDVIHRKLEMLMRITFYNDDGDLAALKLYTTKNKIFSECWGTQWAGGYSSDT